MRAGRTRCMRACCAPAESRYLGHVQAAKLLQLSEADLALALEQGERA